MSPLVTCAVPPLLMTASLAAVGAPAGDQLAPTAQLPVASTQVLTCAWAGAVTAAITAIAASNRDETNSPLARTGDAVPRRDPMEISRCGLHPISGPQQPAMPIKNWQQQSPGRYAEETLICKLCLHTSVATIFARNAVIVAMISSTPVSCLLTFTGNTMGSHTDPSSMRRRLVAAVLLNLRQWRRPVSGGC